MYRNMIGTTSALAILALLAGSPVPGFAHQGNDLCNVILDGDGDPVLESDSDDIGHSNSTECAGDASASTDAGAEQQTAALDETPDAVAGIDPLVVYFDVNEDGLDAGSRAEVDAYVGELMANPPKSLDVTGYTDTSGPADLNARLSEGRANSVAAALIEAGVPASLITRGASGEAELAVDTPDDTREASNRRVTISPSF